MRGAAAAGDRAGARGMRPGDNVVPRLWLPMMHLQRGGAAERATTLRGEGPR